MEWHAIHAYYHEDAPDGLLLDAVRPFFERVAAHVSEYYFLRHWKRGPHVRLNLRTDTHTFERTVWPTAEEVIGSYLREHPSTTVLDPQEMLPVHRQMAEREKETGPLTPWPPNNTLTVEPYDARVHVLGNEETAELMARFHAASTPLTLSILHEVPDHNGRVRVAFASMLATVHAFSPDGLARDYVTFRSHAEGFLRNSPDEAALRDAWDRMYADRAAHLDSELRRVLATVSGERDAAAYVRPLIEVLDTVRRDAEELLAAGALWMPPIDTTATGWKALAENSPFHRALLANPVAMDRLRTDWFTVFRVLLNCTYMNMTRLGISPQERFTLCHLAASAAEHYYGTTAIDLVSGAPA